MEKHNVDEYDSGLSFCYDCIMFMLKIEYPELDIKKLEASVNAYMNEQNNEGGETWDLLRPQLMQPLPVAGNPREQMWILL